MFSKVLIHAVVRRVLFATYTVAGIGLACRLTMVVLALSGLPQPWPTCPEHPPPPPPPPQHPPPPPPRAEEPITNFLVVLAVSPPEAEDRRNALRATWFRGCAQNMDARCYFVVGVAGLGKEDGRRLEEERDLHHDMLLLPDLVDTPTNISLKVLKAFTWAENKVLAQYVMKCNDDTFIRLTQIVNELKEGDTAPSAASIYWGFFTGQSPIEVVGKWWDGDFILCDYYLPFAYGAGYVLGSRLLHFITSNQKELQLYHRDDVSVGTWLAPLKKVRRVHDPRFDTEPVSRGCHNSYLVTHSKSPEEMAAMWQRMRWGSDKPCPGGEETRRRLSYRYDWATPPSRCCRRSDPTVP